jgi:tetratricopeptide (TPR) repeat protein
MNTTRCVPSHFLVLALAFSMLNACSREVAAPDIRPPTDGEVERTMAALERLAEAGDAEGLLALFDVDALVAASRLRISAREREEFAQALRQGLALENGLIDRLITEREEGSLWRVFPTGGPKFDRRAGERWVTLRMLPVDGGFEHIAFRIGSYREKPAAIVDLQVLTIGEPLTATAYTSMEEAKSEETKGNILRRLTRGLWKRDVITEGLDAVKVMRAKVAEDDAVGALEHFASLPSSVKKQRIVLLQRSYAAQHVDEAAQLRAFEDMAKYLPDDPSLLTASIDFHTLHARYADAIDSVNRVKAITVDDAFLDVLIADLAIAAGDFEKAKAAIARATEREPSLVGLRWTEASLHVARGDFAAAAVAYAKMIDDGIDVYVEGLAELDGYADFTASKPYADLLARFGEEADGESDDEDPLADAPKELVAKAGVVREPGYLYYLSLGGDIERTRMVRGGEAKKAGDGPERVKTLGVKREEGYLYFIDKNGDVSRAKMSRE